MGGNKKRIFLANIREILLFLNQKKFLGNDLLSRGVAPQVPSALTALTSGFEM